MISIRKLILFSMIVSIFVGSHSFAASGSRAKLFKFSALNLFRMAKISGVTSLGTGDKRVSLDDLIVQASQVNFVELSHLEKPEGATRFSAFYDPSTKTVYVSAAEKIQDEYLRPLAAHEVLGALGYADEDYQVSLGLHMINSLPAVTSEELESSTQRVRMMEEFYGKDKLYQPLEAENLFFPLNTLGIFERNIRAQTLLKIQMDDAFNKKRVIQENPDSFLNNSGGGSSSGAGGGGSFTSFALKARLFDLLQRDKSIEYWTAQRYMAELQVTDFSFLKNHGISLKNEISDARLPEVLAMFKDSIK